MADGAANGVARHPGPVPLDRPPHRIEKGRGDLAIAALLDAMVGEDDLYERDHALVHIVGAPEPAMGDRAPVAAGTPVVRPMVQATLYERASRCMRWEKYDGRSKDYRPADPPPAVLANIIARGVYPGIRPLHGILSAPGMRPDGSLIWGSGYDGPTGFFSAPAVDFGPMPGFVTEEESNRALFRLRGVFADFPCADEPSRMVPVAGVLTIFARPAILGACPAIVITANTRGSGKTLLADGVALVATGRVPPPMSYPCDDVELEKVLGAYALKSPALIKLDNVTRVFGGGPLDRVLTAVDTVELRVLGKSEIPEMPWRTLILATGNNITMTGDTSRRVIVCRLESPLENPEERPDTEFRHPNLLGWIRENRVAIARDAFLVLRGWVCAGRPQMGCKSWGSFGPWASIVPPAIVWAGGADPMLTRPSVTGEEEPEKAALLGVIEGLERLDEKAAGLTVRQILATLYARERLKGDGPPDAYDNLRDALETLVPTRSGMAPEAKRVGEKLRVLARNRVIAGRKLTAASAGGGVQRWRVEKA